MHVHTYTCADACMPVTKNIGLGNSFLLGGHQSTWSKSQGKFFFFFLKHSVLKPCIFDLVYSRIMKTLQAHVAFFTCMIGSSLYEQNVYED